MHIVVLSPCPEGQEMVQAPREFVAGMRVDSLKESPHDPKVHSQNVQVTGDSTPQDWRSHRSQSKYHHFDGRSIFSSHAKWCRVLMVDFVDVFVERTPMKSAMGPVVPCIFQYEEDRDLVSHLQD